MWTIPLFLWYIQTCAQGFAPAPLVHLHSLQTRANAWLGLSRPTVDTLRLRERIKGILFHEQPPQIVPRHIYCGAQPHEGVRGNSVRFNSLRYGSVHRGAVHHDTAHGPAVRCFAGRIRVPTHSAPCDATQQPGPKQASEPTSGPPRAPTCPTQGCGLF